MGKLEIHEVSGGAALFDGSEHFITLPSNAAAKEVKNLIEAAQASSAPANQIVFAIAKALHVEARVA